MRLTNREVAEIVFSSFKKAFQEKDSGRLEGDNPLRSAYFVSLIGGKLKDHFQDSKVNYQSVDSIWEEKKSGGEWLFDISVTSRKRIVDNRHRDGISEINTNILFACESEFETSLSAFTTDFGKLLCSNANQRLFIQGLNQSTAVGRESFINSRKQIITRQLNHLLGDDLVLAFVPTPGKCKKQSFWDKYEDQVLDWISIWIYGASQNKFIEYKSSELKV